MEKLYLVNPGDEQKTLLFWCPGCKCAHPYTYPRWSWNGSFVKPTFAPSLLCHPNAMHGRCHLFMRDGMIEFCNDCDHELKGQTVEAVDWQEDMW